MKGLGNVHLESRESFVNKPKRINQHEIYPKLYTVTKNDHHAAKDIGTIQYFQKFYIRPMIVSSNYKKKKKKNSMMMELRDEVTETAIFRLVLFCVFFAHAHPKRKSHGHVDHRLNRTFS